MKEVKDMEKFGLSKRYKVILDQGDINSLNVEGFCTITKDQLEEIKPKKSYLDNELDKVLNTTNEDKVNHPSHYNQYEMETIDAIRGQSTSEEFTGYLKGNIMKYISRFKQKNGIEDIEKAIWYLETLHEEVKNHEKES